ncbi:hypothetical protein K450DRAFT_262411 [Umbelopsis ramanniana AG]|uniref:Endonuclease/exonuclease/phosphatase domain-containing protein n=1 Tax=Umbelopsis ramanniana AG TaxID=1314678 RepID=A0AAD5HAL9_UMBRA|nr:uncharacterized protein K450DRAFT_262411 [Umbelopsis ramanniana AG]KAI8575283.1 hypothetical protein K450DRAFT_262411 [Umbelopsis ramanniana AG]
MKIYLQNMKGFSPEKLTSCIQLLDKHLADMIVITESWHFSRYNTYTPYLLATSTHVPRTNGPSAGGLAILARPNLRSSFTLLHQTTHSITFSLHGHCLHALYLPPSMPWNVCQQHMPKTKVSVLLGDINYHPNVPSKKYIPSLILDPRKQGISDLCLQHDLNWITDTPPFKYDHVLLDSSLFTTANTHAPIHPKTDHHLVTFMLPPKPPPSPTSTPQAIRFNLKYLDEPLLADQLIACFELLWNEHYQLMHFLSDQIMQSQDISTTQDIIDTVYALYMSLISTCCETILGTYTPQQRCSEIDHSLNPALPTTIPSDSSNEVNEEIARHSSPMIHCFPLWKALLTSIPTSITLHTLIASIPPFSTDKCTPSLIIHYFSFLTPEKIAKHIMKYPSAKTFGLDVLHSRIFKALSSSTVFLSSMQLLFSTFLFSTLTPSMWNISQITPIPKKSDSFTPSSSRPISLTPCLR